MSRTKLLLLLCLLWHNNFAFSAPQQQNATQIQHLAIDSPQFTVKLNANPSTGYWWQLQKYNQQLLTIAQHRIIKSTHQQRLLGKAGQEWWIFKVNRALAHGKTTELVFIYVRPWDVRQIAQKLIVKVTFH